MVGATTLVQSHFMWCSLRTGFAASLICLVYSRCAISRVRSPETIHMQCSGAAHPRSPQDPFIYVGASPPFKSASGLPMYRIFNRIIAKQRIREAGGRIKWWEWRGGAPHVKGGVWGGAPPPEHCMCIVFGLLFWIPFCPSTKCHKGVLVEII